MLIWQDNEFSHGEADAYRELDIHPRGRADEEVPLPVFLAGIIGFALLAIAMGEALAGSVTR